MGTALLLAEKEYFEDEKVAKAARKADTEACKQRADEANLPGVAHASKHAAVSSDTQATKSSPSNRSVHPFVSESNDRVEEDANGLSEGESDREEGEMAMDTLVQIPLEPAGSLEALLEAAITEKSSELHTTSGKWRKRDLDPAIDYLINMHRYDCIGCRQRVFDVCFGNTAAGGKFLYVQVQRTDSFKFSPQTPTTLSVTPTVCKGALVAISCSQLSVATFTTQLCSPCSKLMSLAHPALLNRPGVSPNTRRIVHWETPFMIGERRRLQFYMAGPLSMTLGHA